MIFIVKTFSPWLVFLQNISTHIAFHPSKRSCVAIFFRATVASDWNSLPSKSVTNVMTISLSLTCLCCYLLKWALAAWSDH
jgi:hypothetical protein